jgi:hypothetical protein
MDLFGPLPTGEFLVVVQCLNSRYPEVAVTHSTSAAAVLPALDKILAAFGVPESIMSDNGPPFNSEEFQRYATKVGFKHRKVIPLAPWSNGTAEKFMQSLGKLVRIAHADKKNWRHELTKFLRAYRGTPHSTTGVTPASLMFNGRPFKTTLPTIQDATETNRQKLAQEHDAKQKAVMKKHADKKAYVRESGIQPGDRLLVAQKKINKLTTPYAATPYTATSVQGSMVTASNGTHTITRHVNLFKRIPDQTASRRRHSLDVIPEEPSREPEPVQTPRREELLRAAADTHNDYVETPPEEVDTTVEEPSEPTETEAPEPAATSAPRRPLRTNRRPPARYTDTDWETPQ